MVELNNIIFSFLLLFFVYFTGKYLLYVFNKSKVDLLVDNQFDKPQAFHENSTYRLGGTIIFSSLVVVFLYLYIYIGKRGMKRFEKRNLFIGNKKPLLCKGFYYLSTESETDYLLIAGMT